MKTVGMVGLGNMGMGMARNLLKHGHAVRGYARRPAVREALVAAGGTGVATAADVARGAQVVIVMVMDAEQVFEIMAQGLGDALEPGAVLVVTATIGRGALQQLAAQLEGREIGLVDAPVSGGKGGADAGTLTLMAAAPPAVLERVDDVLRAIGSQVIHVGDEPGQGQVVKACLQALIGVSFQGLFEAMVLGSKAGIGAEVLASVINHSFVGSKLTASTTAHIVARRFRDTGSHIGTMHKDVGLSLAMARELGVTMPVASSAMQMFQAGLSAMPEGDNWCVVELLEMLAGMKRSPTA